MKQVPRMQNGTITITIMNNLIKKYNVQAPRYTSYPTVPYWDSTSISSDQWINTVIRSFNESNASSGISLYIHLPYCESLCTYCGCNTRITVNHSVEIPYINTLLNEWKLYLNAFNEPPIIRQIHLGGGTPTFFSPQNLKFLIEGLLQNATIHPSHEFSFEAHPANTTLDHLQTLFNLGFKRLSLGVQDFDEKVQNIINRKQTKEDVKRVIDQARTIGFTSINFDLIYGLPLQTIESVKSTIEQAIELSPDRIAFYSYAHVPWIKPGQRKFTEADLPADETKRELYECGKQLFLNAGYVDIGMDHFSKPDEELYKASQKGALHRNFMGYTDQYTQLLIGLGVSSISDSLYGFMQNHKTVEEYMKMVNAGSLAILKGHLLSNEDLILRKHILNIMCNYRTTWLEPNLYCDFLKIALEKLGPLEKDGLVKIASNQVEVTQKGKPFLRNICMAFDAKLHKENKQVQIFSSAI